MSGWELEKNILVLGIGNLLWADEGFGVRALEAMNAKYEFPENVTLMDGGTQGLYLIPSVQESEILIVFDAIDYGLEPGTMKIICDDEVPSYMGAKKVSLHQTGFQEVLASAQFMGWKPERVVLIGVQPVEIEDYGGSLRPLTEAQIEPAIAAALWELAQLGIQPKPREVHENLTADALAKTAYEVGRPDEETAFRHGDDRFLQFRGSE